MPMGYHIQLLIESEKEQKKDKASAFINHHSNHRGQKLLSQQHYDWPPSFKDFIIVTFPTWRACSLPDTCSGRYSGCIIPYCLIPPLFYIFITPDWLWADICFWDPNHRNAVEALLTQTTF